MPYDLVVIGASKGGLRALQALLGGLPPDFPLPVAVVLHRDKGPDEGVGAGLQGHTPLRMEEPDDKQTIEPGRIYLAPTGYHLLIECGIGEAWSVQRGGWSVPGSESLEARQSTLHTPRSTGNPQSYYFALSTDAPVEYARPSVNVLFESAADAYRERVIGVILTGMNQDGARGLAAIQRCGGLAVVQDPATAEARAMPDGAMAAVPEATVLPLGEIGAFLVERGGTDRRQEAGG